MTQNASRPKISRRKFLGLTLATGVTATGGYSVYDIGPWMDYDEQADQTWRPIEVGLAEPEQMRELVRAATLAANGHNAQPWQFAIRANVIELHPDYTRRLPVVDPTDRELWISLGCALENLIVAARAAGFIPAVTYPGAADVIRVELSADTPQTDPACDAIPRRKNVRADYDGQPVPTADLDALQVISLEAGTEVQFITEPDRLETVVEYINTGTLIQYDNDAFLDELIDWLRFNRREALDHLDGLYVRTTGNPESPRWLGAIVASHIKPQSQADADTKKMRHSAGALVIASQVDDKISWIRTGQVYQRLALALTTRGINSAFLNQPLEVPEVRAQFQTAIGLGESSLPQLLIRFGYGGSMPHSLRRPVEQVLI